MDYKPIREVNYVKLAQIVQFSMNGYHIQTILDSGYYINYAVPVDGQIKYFRPEWLGYTALHFAVQTAHVPYRCTMIDELLNRGADFTLKNLRGFTPLRLAFESFVNNSKPMDLLLIAHIKSNNPINIKSDDGISHFLIACFNNNFKAVEFFLKAGVPVNEAVAKNATRFPGYTAFHIAVRIRNKKLAHLLLEYGADYNVLSVDGMSPFDWVDSDRPNLDRFPKKYKSSINEAFINKYILDIISKPSLNGFNPLNHINLNDVHVYCIRKYEATKFEDLDVLLTDDTKINAAINFDSPVWPGYTPMHFAAHGNLEMVYKLLAKGANILTKDAKNTSPLDLCVASFNVVDISGLLIADPELRFTHFDNGSILVEILNRMQSLRKLGDYLKVADVNSIIPLNSPLWPGFTILHLNVLFSPESDYTPIKMCLKYGADLTIRDANNMTPLHLAVYKKQWSCLKVIANNHTEALPNPVDDNNLSHFHIFCAINNLKVSKTYLELGVDPNLALTSDVTIPWDDKCSRVRELCGKFVVKLIAGSTALHIASTHKYRELVKVLLEFKADPNIRDSQGFTSFHRAFMKSPPFNTSITPRILKLYLNNLNSNLVSPGGLSYLHIACYAANLSAVKELLPYATTNINVPLTSEIRKYVNNLEEKVCLGDTPLHFAAKFGTSDIISSLLTYGADVTVKNEKGLNPLHVALPRLKSKMIIKRLASAWMKKNKWPDDIGLTPLHIACILQDISAVKRALKDEDVYSNIYFDSPLWPGFTPLQLAIRSRDTQNDEIVNILLNCILQKIEKSAPITQEVLGSVAQQKLKLPQYQGIIHPDGLSAFHVSCMGKNPDIVMKFLKLGADVRASRDHFAIHDFNYRDSYCTCNNAGFSPLHFATLYANKDVIEILLNHGADVCFEDTAGETPLHLAAKLRFENFKVLMKFHEVDINMKTRSGHTFLDLLLTNQLATSNEFLLLLKSGAAENINFARTIALVKEWIKKFTDKTFSSLIDYIPNINYVDANGCNLLHHLAKTKSIIYHDEYVSSYTSNIEYLVKCGCALDYQDEDGKTPLHYSVLSNCPLKVRVLFAVGADINVEDKDGETPYSFLFDENISPSLNAVDTIIFEYIDKLIATGLYMSPVNNDCNIIQKTCRTSEDDAYSASLNRLNQKIFKSITLRDLLRDKTVMNFPLMPARQRQIILEYLEPGKALKWIHKTYEDWSPFFKLQYRKVLKRNILFKEAVDVLPEVLNKQFPEHIKENILICLDNKDFNNIISIANNVERDGAVIENV